MTPIQSSHYELLKLKLQTEFVPLLPVILDSTKPPEQLALKNLSRAFSAFVLHQLCSIALQEAASAVVDDFDDKGIDAIYYHSLNDTLYLVQSKFKESQQFGQDEALAFCQGIRKLIAQDLIGFNKHIQEREVEIQDAVEKCAHIQLVVAQIGSGISVHARDAISELLLDSSHGEDRFCDQFIDYAAEQVIQGLQESKAHGLINGVVHMAEHASITAPRNTHFGLIGLLDLVALYNQHGVLVYEKNIRTFLGKQTDVNSAIRRTLTNEPANFFYLNNGVTALAHRITPKGPRPTDKHKRLELEGFSIVNGAQTITSAAQFLKDNPTADLGAARVAITIIEVAPGEDFGKAITQARNHQNQVTNADFAALDNEQERLRRELALLGFHYVYKGGADAQTSVNTIRIEEAAYGLSLFQKDPRFVVWLKREPGRFLTVDSDQYKALFSSSLTAHQVVNAVRFRRYIQQRVANITVMPQGQERLTYKHGEYALGWLLAQQVSNQQAGSKLLDEAKISVALSRPFDELRQILWDEIRPYLDYKGPLAVFRSQTDIIPFLQAVATEQYLLTGDIVLTKKPQRANEPYPIDLFKYILDKAPQLSNLL